MRRVFASQPVAGLVLLSESCLRRDDYISQAFLHKLGRRHESSPQTMRENICCVAADDDIHYTLIGMLLLENKGLRFGHSDIYNQWLINVPPLWTWGAERTTALTTAINAHHLLLKKPIEDCHDVLFLNPWVDAASRAIGSGSLEACPPYLTCSPLYRLCMEMV